MVAAAAGSVEGEGEAAEAAQGLDRLVAQRLAGDGEAHVGEAAVELADGDLALHAGELVAEAEVLAEGEREVFVGVSGQIELVGRSKTFSSRLAEMIIPSTLAPLGRTVPSRSTSSNTVRAAPQGTGVVKRSSSSTAGLGQRRVVAPTVGLVGVLDEGEGRAADEVGRRVVPGQHEEEDHGDDLVVIEPVAVLAGLEQRRDHAVVGTGPALVGQAEQDGVELAGGGDGPDGVGGRAAAQADDEALHQTVELVTVLVAHAEHGRDDREREGDGDLVDEVDRDAGLGLALGVVEQAVDDALDLVLELGDAAGVKALLTRRRRRA